MAELPEVFSAVVLAPAAMGAEVLVASFLA